MQTEYVVPNNPSSHFVSHISSFLYNVFTSFVKNLYFERYVLLDDTKT